MLLLVGSTGRQTSRAPLDISSSERATVKRRQFANFGLPINCRTGEDGPADDNHLHPLFHLVKRRSPGPFPGRTIA